MNDKNHSKFESSQIISMFPTFVWQTMLKNEVYQTINESILNKLAELKQSISNISPSGNWQSNQKLHELKEFQALISCVNTTTTGVLEFLKIGHNGFNITGCWANLNSKSAIHRNHSHPNNFLSGVYYVQAPEGADTINFHDPRIQTGIIRPPVTELTNENTDQVVVRVKQGMFLLFPSWLQHSVDPNQSDQTRISISFNIMFSPYVETMSKPLW